MYLEISKNCIYKSCCIVDLLRQKGNSNNCLGKGEIITKNLENFTLLFPSHTYNHKTFNNFCDRVAKVFRNFRGRRREQRSRFIEEFGCISWEKFSSEQKSRHETMGTCGLDYLYCIIIINHCNQYPVYNNCITYASNNEKRYT